MVSTLGRWPPTDVHPASSNAMAAKLFVSAISCFRVLLLEDTSPFPVPCGIPLYQVQHTASVCPLAINASSGRIGRLLFRFGETRERRNFVDYLPDPTSVCVRVGV